MNEPSLVRFGVFEMDVRTGELRKHGVRLKIQDQPFQVLQVLVERPGELVTREELRTRIWANDTFVDFDQSLNRAINKVRDVLSDTAGSPRFVETLPRRGYRFIAPIESVLKTGPLESVSQPGLPSPTAMATRSYTTLIWTVASFLAIAIASVWLARDRGAPPTSRVIPLTTLTGRELFPAFSPDGKQIAFAWNGERQDNFDLYVKVIGEVTPLRLTTDPADDGFPAWSPDARHIAFTRAGGQGGVYLVSPLGGPERKLAGLVTDGRPSWSKDGKYLLVAQQYFDGKTEPGNGALFLVPVASGDEQPRQILTPPPGSRYKDPAYAPDGRSLAFALCTGAPGSATCALQVVGLQQGLVPSGDPRTIQRLPNTLGVAWTSDGSSLIYGNGAGEIGTLWQVGVSGNKAERLELAGVGAYFPALDFKAGRLAFHRASNNIDIWRLDRGGKPYPFLTSSLVDGNPQYSPDGHRIAFASGRQGDQIAVWVANADGTGVNQITRIASPRCGTPRWSPDGLWIAFDASGEAGDYHVWVVEASGGSPRQLTHGPALDAIPSWSADGNWVYFGSKRTGRPEIWRVSKNGGTPEQITRTGGWVAFESADGKTLYHTVSQAGAEGLYARRLQDGTEKQVVKDKVAVRGFEVFSDGVYYLYRRAVDVYEIRFHEFASGRVQVIGEIKGRLEAASGLAVSPDRKTFLFSIVDPSGADLMLIENFR